MKPSLPESNNVGRENFLSKFSVSHETAQKFDRYAELLTEWNEKFNLVAASTIPDLWTRHVLDSAQLKTYINDDKNSLIDLGSGAGFPGIVLSLLGIPDVHLVESIRKKAKFLTTVVEELKLDAVVHNARAESLKGLKADIVTARAVAPLKELVNLSKPFLKKDSVCLFLKGKSVENELAESQKYLTYKCERHPSLSDPSGSILLIRDLTPATYKARYFKKHR